MEIPSPLTPGSWAANAGVTAALMMLERFPEARRPVDTKSSTVTTVAGLQAYPAGLSGNFTSATQKSWTAA